MGSIKESNNPRPPFSRHLIPILSQIPPLPNLHDYRDLTEQRKLFAWSPEQVFASNSQIEYRDETIPGPNGPIAVSILTRKGSVSTSRPGIYYLHAGGQIMGTRFFMLQQTFDWILDTDAVLISAEYRLAPEHPSPAAFNDARTGLEWILCHCKELGINPERLLIAGASAGGGLAASLALKARDMGAPKLCGQLLIYPMLDDRCGTTSMEQFATEGTWVGNANKQAWEMILPGRAGSDKVDLYEVPGRATQLAGLPPTFIDVGATEPFRDECVVYASDLWRDGVDCELHVWPGTFHASDSFVPEAYQTKGALLSRAAWVRDILLP